MFLEKEKENIIVIFIDLVSLTVFTSTNKCIVNFFFFQTMLTAISMSAIATNGVVPGITVLYYQHVFKKEMTFKPHRPKQHG